MPWAGTAPQLQLQLRQSHIHCVCVFQAQDKTQGAQYIQNYTKLAAGVFQLAAWTYGESPDTTQISGGADENNSNSANSGFSQHILPPRLATLALQKGPAGVILMCSRRLAVVGH